ncbi:MAG: hypothetical protein PHY12_16135 [Eubacteriales bacterium]|nr:hypothetical protein [Eubacteriales bacterium]
MMNQSFRLCALLLALSLGCAGAEENTDPVVVRVGDMAYRQSVVQAFLTSIAQQARAAGDELDEQTAQGLMDAAVEGYVDLGVTELKCAELGLTDLTDEQKAVVDAAAQDAYDTALEAYVEQIEASFGADEAKARESAPTLMSLNGYTYEAFYAQQLSQYHNKLMLDYVTRSASFTQEEIAAYFDQAYVAADRALYQNNFPQFERDVIVNGKNPYYFPAGMRVIDILWLETPAEYADRLTALSAASAEDELAERAELLAEIGESYRKEIAAIGVAAAAGGAYDDLLADDPTLTLDDGYLVHAESSLWGNEMRDTALALQKVGDVSDVLLLGGRLCVLCYRAEIAEGLPPYDDASLQQMYACAEQDMRVTLLDEQLEKWKSDYTIETHPELLTVPEA